MISKFWSQTGKSLRQILHSERGIVLAEALVTMAIAGIVITAFLYSMTTTSKAIMVSHQLVTAESLAKNQMEYMRGQPYDPTNPPHYDLLPEVDKPEGYDVIITAERLNPKNPDDLANDVGLQKFTVVVNHDGVEVFKLESYRMDR